MISLLGDATPDFSDPLGLLAACHQRILDNCALLERMPDWLAAHGPDDEMRRGAERAYRYFSEAAPQHHADEEKDLFPRLARSPDLAPVLAKLEREHATLDGHWLALEEHLLALCDGRHPGDWQPALQGFIAAYRAHVEQENRKVLPAARERLDAAELATVGRAMAARRGVRVPG